MFDKWQHCIYLNVEEEEHCLATLHHRDERMREICQRCFHLATLEQVATVEGQESQPRTVLPEAEVGLS